MKDSARLNVVRNKLIALRGDCDAWLEGSTRELFDEFMGVEECELALHLICDQILDQSAVSSEHVVTQIEELHRLMEISDDCVAEIRRKLSE